VSCIAKSNELYITQLNVLSIQKRHIKIAQHILLIAKKKTVVSVIVTFHAISILELSRIVAAKENEAKENEVPL
jgi:hypothetical protein